MNDMGQDAKAVAIYQLLRGYWQLQEKLSETLVDTYTEAVADCSTEAVILVCKRIAAGKAGLNSSFPPTPADIAERSAAFDEAVKERVPQYNGLIEMDWGHGSVDLRGLTNAEQDAIIRLHGIAPDGTNFATLTLDGIRAKLKEVAKLAPPKRAAAPVEAPKPWLDPTGWVEWSPDWGDFPPIDQDDFVWLKFSDGEVAGAATRWARHVSWRSTNPETRIIAYKLDRRVKRDA